jgi:excisionase family DNA binding protein
VSKNGDDMPEKEWFNVSEAAEYLQVSRQTIYKLMQDGVLPYTKVRGLQGRRIRKQDVDALFESFGRGEATEKEN